VPYRLMNKASVFDPNAIEETNFAPGRHFARPTGTVRLAAGDELLNLHYKYLGMDYIRARHAELLAKIGDAEADESAVNHWRLHDRQLDMWLRLWTETAVDVTDRSRAETGRRGHPMDPGWLKPVPWWRIRWWHVQYWWARLPAGFRTRVWRLRLASALSRKPG
jgi:hypothetical protein